MQCKTTLPIDDGNLNRPYIIWLVAANKNM